MIRKQMRHILSRWKSGSARKIRRRVSMMEQLEARQMMAAAVWTNVLQPLDVSADSQAFITPKDALLVINELNSPFYSDPTTRRLPDIIGDGIQPPFVDVSCDGFVTPRDALLVINRINSPSDGAGNAAGFRSTWSFDSSGGSVTSKSRVSANACAPRLIEGDSYRSQLSTNLVLPDATSAVTVLFDAPSFDLTSKNAIRDAFEIAVLDASGQPLVLPYAPGRDTAFNWSEGLDPSIGPATQFVTGSATINLAGIAGGSIITVQARMVNNDLDDNSSITVRGIEVIDSPTPAPSSFRPLADSAGESSAVDLSQLIDVSSSMLSVYGRTTLSKQDKSLLSTELQLFNSGTYPIVGSLVAVLDKLSDPNIGLLNPDGFMPDGRPYLNLTAEMGQSLAPGGLTAARSLQFKNQTGERFTYQFQILSNLNQAPQIESLPDAIIAVGDQLSLQVRATDPEGRPLTYSLLSAPQGMSIDATSGRLHWTPVAADVGNAQVRIQAEDPLGSTSSVAFTVSVRTILANRPPIITSTPSTDTTVARPFDVFTYKTGDGPTAIATGDFGSGQISIVTTNAGESQIGLLPGIDAPGTEVGFGSNQPLSVGEPSQNLFATPFATAFNVPLDLEPLTFQNNQRNVQDVRAEDVNGDGNADLIVLASLNESGALNRREPGFVLVRLGNGDGTFREGFRAELPSMADRVSRASSVHWADVTGDNVNDLIVTMLVGLRTLVYPGMATGLFGSTPIESTNVSTHVVASQLADINGDGKHDLVLIENPSHIGGRTGASVQFGDDTGRFIGSDFYETVADGWGYLIDADGVNGIDLVRLSYNNTRLEVHLNDGTGRFGTRMDSPTKSFYSASNPQGSFLNPTSAMFADYDGDQKTDAIVTGPQGIALLKGQGNGTFGNGTAAGNPLIMKGLGDSPTWPGHHQSDGRARDINGDGKLDFFFGDTNHGSNVILGIGQADSSFAIRQYSVFHSDDIGTGAVKHARSNPLLALADFNRDGVVDIAIGSLPISEQPGSIGIILGDKPGTLRAPNFVTDYSGTQGRLGNSVAGDFNNDGNLDVATFGGLGFGSALFVANGNGDGTFSPYTPVIAGYGYSPITLDIDKDGNLDLAWSEGGLLRQAFGLGNGAFQSLPNVAAPGGDAGVSKRYVHTDDFNRDGYPDLVYRRQNGHIDINLQTHVVVLLYDPTARRYNILPDATNLYSITPRAYGFYHDESLGMGDLNNDGNSEFFFFARNNPNSGTPSRLTIIEKSGRSGSDAADLFTRTIFENPSFIPEATSVHDWVVDDFDGDGKNDIAYSTHDATTTVMFGNGDFTFRNPTTYLTNGFHVSSGDFNGDGHTDLATTWGYGFISFSARPFNGVLLGNPDGSFGQHFGYATATGTTNESIIGDFNGDGKDDLAGLGGLKHSEVLISQPQGLADIAVGDVNGDGHTDTISVNSAYDRVKLLWGSDNIDNRLDRQNDLIVDRYPVAVELADLDVDGVLDILTANKLGRSLSLLKHTSLTHFSKQDVDLDMRPTDLAVGDMNGDSKPDAVVISEQDQVLQVLIGAAGTLSVGHTLPLGFHPTGLALGDVTGDGKLDALVTDSHGGRILILDGKGDGTFLPSRTISLTGAPSAIATADMNGDGRGDLIVALSDSDQIGILFNRGSGRYTTPQRITVGDNPQSIQTRDMNRDGRPDVLVANQGDDTASVIINRFDPANVYQYKPTAIDPDGDSVTFELTAAPGGMLYDDATNTILWAPMPEQIGPNQVVLTANDGNGGTAEQGFVITVTQPASTVAPIFTSQPITALGASEVYSYQPRVQADQAGPLKYSLVDAPDGMSIDPTSGVVHWDPRSSAIRLVENFSGVNETPSYRNVGHISIPHSASLEPTSVTVEGWYNFHDPKGALWEQLLSKSSSPNAPWLTSWGIEYYYGTLRANVGKPGVNANLATVSAPAPVLFGKWTHVAMTYDDSTRFLTLYINGINVGSTISPESIGYAQRTVNVGGNYVTMSRARVWNVARSAAEIQRDMLADIPEDASGLVLKLQFDESQDVRSVIDSSAFANHGALINTPDRQNFPKREPGLSSLATYPIAIQVEDGRGGIAMQRFNVTIDKPFDRAISGNVFDDANSNGIRDLRADDNLVVNGQFDSGRSGFSTEFVLMEPRTGFGWMGNSQAVVQSSSMSLPLTGDWSNHTNQVDGGSMLVINGDQQDRVAWRQTIPVEVGTNYAFSFWALRPNTYEAARLSIRVNGVPVGNAFSLADMGNGAWKRFQTTWTADSATATVEIVSLGSLTAPNPGLTGVENSTAIDDILWVPTTAKTLVVRGNTNPYLAGMPDGSTAFGSTAPTNSPPSISVTPGQVLRFETAGWTTYQFGNLGRSADGKPIGGNGQTTQSALNGISQLMTPNGGSLLGVFLDDNSPSGQTPPTGLDFRSNGNVVGGTDFASLSPELRQLFFIGDGQSNGNEQTVVVPAGATRLFLANGSATTWNNESGAIEVQVFTVARGEVGVSGRTIFVDANLNNRFDNGEATTQTDAQGNYVIDVRGDNARVGLMGTSGQLQTWPSVPYRFVPLNDLNGFYSESMDDYPTRIDFGTADSPLDLVPIFTSQPPRTAVQPGHYAYEAFAQASDGNGVTYALAVGPDGMFIDAASGLLQWIPNLLESGSVDVIVKATDSTGRLALQRFSIDVTINTAPVITSAAVSQAILNTAYRYDLRAQDAEQSSLNYELLTSPPGMTIDRTTGRVDWVPASAGTAHVVVRASDGMGLDDIQGFDVSVVSSASNNPPQLVTGPRAYAVVGRTYGSLLSAVDVDHEPLAFSLVNGPSGLTIDANGKVLWNPETLGAFELRVAVTDARGGRDEKLYTIDVANRAGVNSVRFSSQPDLAAVVGTIYAYDSAASGATFYEIIRGPVGLSIDSQRGTLRWLPSAGQTGFHSIAIRASDELGNTAEQSFTVTVRSTSLVPSISSAPPTEAFVGQTYLYSVGVANPSRSPLSFSLSVHPNGMTIDGQTGVISWTPQVGQTGAAPVIVRVSDGVGNFASQSFSIDVASGTSNRPPVINSSAPLDATVGQALVYTLAAIDAEGQPVTYSVRSGPAGLSINATSGTISWTPSASDVGAVPVVLVASDPLGGAAVQAFTLDVRAANRAPVVRSTPPSRVSQGAVFQYDVIAEDLDREPLFYTLLNGPDGMTIDSLGRLRWKTMLDTPLGTRSATVLVADGQNGSTTHSMNFDVTTDTQAPRLTIIVSGEPVLYPWTSAPARVRVIASDDVGLTNVQLKVDGQFVELAADGTTSVYFSAPGNGRLEAIATDAAGNRGTAFGRVSMRSGEEDGSGNPAPEAKITSVTDGVAVGGFVDVIGTAASPDFQSYTLSYRRVDEPSYKTILNRTSPVTAGSLGKWDTTLLENDNYILKLEVLDTFGSFAAQEVEVSVSSNLKLGNFRLSFEDMTIPVAGIPITITRTYDTLRRDRDGDFGYGWRLEYRNTDLRTNLPKSGLEDIGIYTPFKQGTKVFVTLPGGERQGFVFTPDIKVLPGFGRGNDLVLASPRFTSDRGVTSTLSAGSGQLTVNEFGELYAAGGIPWNPASPDFADYTLVTANGTRYTIDGSTGLMTTASDRNGNTLTFSDAGITSSVGSAGVVFSRDMHNRIDSITDMLGKSVRYSYSSDGDLIQVSDRELNNSQYAYNADGKHTLIKVIDPLGREGIRAEYDANGRLSKTFDAAGSAVTVQYDPANEVVTAIDPLGNPTTIEYDSQGNTIRTTNALGGVTRSVYDSENNETSQIDAVGRTKINVYDEKGFVIRSSDFDGNMTQYSRNQFGQILASIDALGFVTKNVYDSRGNIVTTIDANGGSTQFKVDSSGNLIEKTDSLGNKTVVTRDSSGRIISSVDPSGSIENSSYDANGNLLSQSTTRTLSGGVKVTDRQSTTYDANGRAITSTDPTGGTTQFTYDANGNIHEIKLPDGSRTTHQYDLKNRVSRIVDPDGSATNISYDLVDRPISITHASNATILRRYDALGRITSLTLQDGSTENITYDGIGRILSTADGLGRVTSFSYSANKIVETDATGATTTREMDALGRTIRSIDELGRITSTVFDGRGLPIKVTLPDGSSTTTTWTANEQIASTRNALGHTNHFSYDANGRISKVTDPLGGTTQYGYDEVGNNVAITDALGRVTRQEFDAKGRVVRRIKPLGQAESFTYDSSGRLVNSTDANGNKSTLQYDAKSQLAKILRENENDIAFGYDANGQRTSAGGSRYEYDSVGRITRVTDPNNATISYAYNAAGQIVQTITAAGITRTEYDIAGRIAKITDPSLNTTEFTYDSTGNLLRQISSSGATTAYMYDELNRIVEIANSSTSGPVSKYSYVYNAAGLVIQVVENGPATLARTILYDYDANGRLVREETKSADPTKDTIATYTFDLVGNRVSKVVMANSILSTIDYVYDENDRLISERTTVAGGSNPGVVTKTHIYDGNGNLKIIRSISGDDVYSYDSSNRLIRFQTAGGSTIEYEYDADGNRIASITDGIRTTYVIDELNGPSHAVVESVNGVVSGTTFNGAIPLTRTTAAGNQFYFVDGAGSVRQTISGTGVVTSASDTDAYGIPTRTVGVVGSLRYRSEMFDAMTNTYFLRARHYEPSQGRFLSVDSFQGLNRVPQSLHDYNYVHGDPVNFSDPSGHSVLVDVLATLTIRNQLLISTGVGFGFFGATLAQGGDFKTAATNGASAAFKTLALLGGLKFVAGLIQPILLGAAETAAISLSNTITFVSTAVRSPKSVAEIAKIAVREINEVATNRFSRQIIREGITRAAEALTKAGASNASEWGYAVLSSPQFRARASEVLFRIATDLVV